MRLLKSLLAALTARWLLTLLACVVLATLIWFHGDLLAFGEQRPLAGEPARLLAILVIALLWAAGNFQARVRARRRNAKLVAELAAPAARPDPADAELAELARRFTAALDQLKKRRLGGARAGRRWLYELPWYVMIGPPGSGKTTALVQSGLRFPLGPAKDLRGVGGTRHCDWLFTDEAVLIDTAGRYTSQDSDREGDAKAWRGFLELLRRHRPRQPLNGVLVALSLADLLQPRGQGGVIDHAASVRARLAEIETALGVRVPVYLLLTKADLIAGFTDFFGGIGERERAQVWGATLPHEPGAVPTLDLDGLRQGLDGLVARLDRLLPQRLADEPDLERRARILRFPAELRALTAEIAQFVEAAFAGSSYESQPLLRGVYLTSGTQVGTPVDRLMDALAQSVGLPRVAPPALATDRSFFLTRLLREVIFGEASLVGRDPARERRERLLRAVAFAGLTALLVATVAAWTLSYTANRDRQLALEQALAAWTRDAAPVAKQRLSAFDAPLGPVAPLLGRLADLDAGIAAPEPWRYRFGLSLQSTTAAQAATAYDDALRDLLLPRLVLRLEEQIRRRIDDADFLLEALKPYLMLGGEAPADEELLAAWFDADLAAEAPALAAGMGRHVERLAARLPRFDARPNLDRDLLARARETLAQVPLAKRAWSGLLASDAARELPGWKVTDHAGPNASTTLVRRSGQPLGALVPGIFTYAGFHDFLLPILDEAAQAAFAENWVLGASGRPEPGPAELARLKADMLKLYYDDAIAAWEGVLRDVTLAPLGSLAEAVERTKALSGPSSPLKLLVQAIVTETRLTVPPPAPAEAEGGGPDKAKIAKVASRLALRKLGGKLRQFTRLLGSRTQAAVAAEPAEVPGAPVEAHFAGLAGLVEGVNGAPPALDEAIAALDALNARLAEATLSPNPAEAFARIGPLGAAQLARAAARLPVPLGPMLGGIAETASALGASGVREQLNGVWRSEVLPFCRQALGGRFPFARAGTADASLEDVQRLFAGGGLIAGFVDGRLAPYLDTTRRPWGDRQGLGLSPAALVQLERAKRIGASLFGAGVFKAGFSLTPLELDAGSASVTLDVDGQELRYDHGPAQPKSFVWPGPGGTGLVRLSFAAVGGGTPATIVREGAWSLFRLLHEAEFRRTGQPDLFEVALAAGGHRARFRLRAGSVDNPFDLTLLAGFACPETL
jgi:type VI secretion system protein ImpL